MEFAAPGVYVLRASAHTALGQQMVAHWLLHNIQPACQGCLWLTTDTPRAVRVFLDTILSSHRKGPKGLDILCLNQNRNIINKKTPETIQDLCRSLNTLTVLKPSLVIVEEADAWLGQTTSTATTINHMQLLQRWAQHANARVILPWQGELPHWSTFATGFAEVNSLGDWVFSPWWPSEQGMQSMLWNESRSASHHNLLHASAYPNLKTLGLAIYNLRFMDQNPGRIYILNNTGIDALDAIALLRLGADEVLYKTQHLPKQTQILHPTSADFKLAHNDPEQANAFAKDLHELWMPGRLRCLPAHQFAQNGQMTLQLMQPWGLHAQVVRLSLRKHIQAHLAIRLLNSGLAGAMFCATREAIYALKVWATPPTPQAFEEWLHNCFYERLETILSGHVVVENRQQQLDLLASVHEEFNIELDDIDTTPERNMQPLPDLWNNTANTNNTSNERQQRPWLVHLEQHFQGKSAP